MTEPITLQELAGASENAQSFDSFLNDDATTIVTRRSASDINTLDYYRDYLHGLELVYSQQSGTVTVNGVETKTVTQAVQDAINDNASIFKGDKGDSGTIETFTVSTGAAGTSAQVTLGGTPQAREIALTVPRGDKGETGNLPNIYSTTTLDAPNVHIASDGTFKRSNDTTNAASRKVGTATGNLVERGADGYPNNNNVLGSGQTMQDVSSSRAVNTIYQNTTGRTIFVFIALASSVGTPLEVSNNGTTWFRLSAGNSTTKGSAAFPIPNGCYYRQLASSNFDWVELR